ncbi:MAG: hypothetical protein LBD85_00560 [Oscillospiraceae bacterium]|jgi:hypothetical protein|nr:hypothetical protein [Oscillospiraceae bacterium]
MKQYPKSKQERLGGLLDELCAVGKSIFAEYEDFNQATEPSHIESAIFAFNGSLSRYDYILRQIKSLTPPRNAAR